MKHVQFDNSALPAEVVEVIANRLLEDDVVDYISFRAVCRYWRSLTASPCSFAFKFRPRRWIMVPDPDNIESDPAAPQCFLNLSTGRSLMFHLPELKTHSILIVSSDGLLVLVHKEDSSMRLFNPFTCHLSDDLPPLKSEYPGHTRKPIGRRLVCLSDDDSPNPSILLSSLSLDCYYYAKLGDDRWKYLFILSNDDSGNFLNGKFYYISRFGLCSYDQDRMTITRLIPLQCPRIYYGHHHNVLIKIDSGLLLLRRTGYPEDLKFYVFRVDLERNSLVEFDLRDHALFTGFNQHNLLVSSKSWPSIRANSIYCVKRISATSHETAIYSLHNQSFELLSDFHGASPHVYTLAHYLLKYCAGVGNSSQAFGPILLSEEL